VVFVALVLPPHAAAELDRRAMTDFILLALDGINPLDIQVVTSNTQEWPTYLNMVMKIRVLR
jgi:hypothetical protein